MPPYLSLDAEGTKLRLSLTSVTKSYFMAVNCHNRRIQNLYLRILFFTYQNFPEILTIERNGPKRNCEIMYIKQNDVHGTCHVALYKQSRIISM
jgi:hypothetical protein